MKSAICLLSLVLLVAADTIVLKNGSVFEGKIVQETETTIVLQMDMGRMTFKKADCKEITRSARPAPPPAAEPPRTAEPTRDDDLTIIPQSPRVTLPALEMPFRDLLAEFERQTGWPVDAPFGREKQPIQVEANDALFWEAVLAISRKGPYGIEFVSEARSEILVLNLDDSEPLLIADIHGPVMLATCGLFEENWFEPETAEQWIKRPTVKLALWVDPRSAVRFESPRLDPEFEFTMEDGSVARLQADKEQQRMPEGRAWLFTSRPEWTSARADIRVTVPVFGATAKGEAVFPWKGGASGLFGVVRCEVKEVKVETKEVSDPDDWFKTSKVEELVATCFIVHQSASEMHKLVFSGREPTEEEKRQVEEMVLAPYEVVLEGEDGTRVTGLVDTAPGWSGATIGYTFYARFRPGRDGFVPKRIQVQWGQEFKRFDVAFTLRGVTLK